MSSVLANDWQAVGIAQVGGAVGVGAAIYAFQFRSRNANCSAQCIFAGAGIGGGGSLGGGVLPSPLDVVNNTRPDLWSNLSCTRSFSSDELNHSLATLKTIGAAGAVGYFSTQISGALLLFDGLFVGDVSGWGTGVGVVAAILYGAWIRLNETDYY